MGEEQFSPHIAVTLGVVCLARLQRTIVRGRERNLPANCHRVCTRSDESERTKQKFFYSPVQNTVLGCSKLNQRRLRVGSNPDTSIGSVACRTACHSNECYGSGSSHSLTL